MRQWSLSLWGNLAKWSGFMGKYVEQEHREASEKAESGKTYWKHQNSAWRPRDTIWTRNTRTSWRTLGKWDAEERISPSVISKISNHTVNTKCNWSWGLKYSSNNNKNTIQLKYHLLQYISNALWSTCIHFTNTFSFHLYTSVCQQQADVIHR